MFCKYGVYLEYKPDVGYVPKKWKCKKFGFTVKESDRCYTCKAGVYVCRDKWKEKMHTQLSIDFTKA